MSYGHFLMECPNGQKSHKSLQIIQIKKICKICKDLKDFSRSDPKTFA